MNTKINILNASEKFTHVLKLLETKSQIALVDISSCISLPKLDVVISPCSDEYKTNSGILGCLTTPYLIDIMLDIERKDINRLINNDLPSVMAHEIHHAIRAISGVEERTLFQILVSEGLACHFETKFNGNIVPSLFNEIQKYNWRDLYKKMECQFSEIDFNYPVYFGGKDEAMFPNRAGYWVGYNIVIEYIKKYGGCAVTLVDIPAEKMMIL